MNPIKVKLIQQSLSNLTPQQTNTDVSLAYAPGTNLYPTASNVANAQIVSNLQY